MASLPHILPATIIIVDNDSTVRSEVRCALEKRSHRVLEADNGQTALDLCRSEDVDLIISDLVIPKVDGLALIGALAKEFSSLPIIITVTENSVKSAVRCMKAGAADCLMKPLDLEELDTLVQEHINGRILKLSGRGDDMQQCGGIAHYKFLGSIGKGAYAEVFLAKSTRQDSDKKFAVKVQKLPDNEGLPLDIATLFLCEAEAASRIRHPNVASIYDYGWEADQNCLYLVVEYVQGRDLAEFIVENNAISYRDKAKIILQIADALSAVHELNILHRDIKPANVLVTDQLLVKVTDFGVAELLDPCFARKTSVIGTPIYMAPEAFENEIDVRSEVFSLGIVAYELFLGQRPFHFESINQAIIVLATELPDDPIKIDKGIPNCLRQILARMLRKIPGDRYQTMAQLANDLRRFLDADSPEEFVVESPEPWAQGAFGPIEPDWR